MIGTQFQKDVLAARREIREMERAGYERLGEGGGKIMEPIVKHGKHKGRRIYEVIRDDPNYALYAHSKYDWFPKLSPEQVKDCWSRYKRLWPVNYRTGLEMRDWSTYDMADYGDGWC